MNIIWLLIALASFHVVDMLCTIQVIKKLERKYKNPYEFEFNFHKWFFKRFGIVKGGFISMFISLPLLLCFGFVLLKVNINAFFMMLGIQMGIAYNNYVSYISYDETDKKLKRRK